MGCFSTVPIYKVYRAGDNKKDLETLEMLCGICVPSIIANTDSSLCYKYIEGTTLLEILEKYESDDANFEPYISMLIEFLRSLYFKAQGYVFGDVNLRNFVVSEKQVYGVDIEDVKLGDKHSDVGRIAAYILSYYPINTDYKKAIVKFLFDKSVEVLHLNYFELENERKKELKIFKMRR